MPGELPGAAVARALREPIAIIGIGCRFPHGGSDPRAFWDMLRQGVDAITEVPRDRWDARRFYDPDPDKPGKTYAKQGGFLSESLYHFDPLAFGMSPREANTLDPQQRLLLEVTWEALEDAGLRLDDLTGSATGVFIGAFALDMKMLQSNPLNRDALYAHSTTGASMTLLANRLSYVFDWRGPSLTIDTACSSSLVATHEACQSLWRGECDLAIAGGANAMLRPEYFIVMSKGHFLSPSGRCHAFDARADGYVRGEGAGVVILKPLAAALRDNDPIYALIRATGVNQDGHTAGISLPNQAAQEELITSVYRDAGVSPSEVYYIEAHGTGTKAGDPVEARALHRALSPGRAAGQRAVVGSVKTNIGHLEAGAGIAGLIKATLCLHHREIPPNLHFEHPNPEIPFDAMCIRVPTALEQWPATAGPRYAGVNSFGYGGTNSHVLLQAAPDRLRPSGPRSGCDGRPSLIPLSARSDSALHAVAAAYANYVVDAEKPVRPAEIAYTTALRRSHHYHRAAIIAATREELCGRLHALADGAAAPGIILNQTVAPEARRLAFIYTGMGPQWWAMGRELLASEPAFRAEAEACDAIFRRHAGCSILEAMTAPEAASRMAETQVAQPANFVLQAALTALWRSWGIVPEAVAGHSVGEVTSAYVSGALSLDDAVLVSFHRSRLQQTRAGLGTMLAVGLPEAEAAELIGPYSEGVDIGAVNGLASISLSGDAAALQAIAAALEARGVFHRFLQVDVAYHSHQMDAVRDKLLMALAPLRPSGTAIPLYSTVTGNRIAGSRLGAEYWWRNVRRPVRFAAAMQALLADGCRTFVEIGPHPVLHNAIADALRSRNAGGHALASLRRQRPERATMLEGLGALYTLGFAPDWHALTPPDAEYVKLPTYPWQRAYHWHETNLSKEDRLGGTGSPFLSAPLHMPTPAWEVELNAGFFPYLSDHCLDNAVVFPGTGYVEAGLAMHQALHPQAEYTLEALTFHKMLVVDAKDVTIMHLAYEPRTHEYKVFSRRKGDELPWELHASGRLLPGDRRDERWVDLAQLRDRCSTAISATKFYEHLGLSRFQYGPHFQVVQRIWLGRDQALAELRAHPAVADDPTPYTVHPALLDGSLQLITLNTALRASRPWVPVGIERVIVRDSPPAMCWAHTQIVERGEGTLRGNIVLCDDAGRVLVEMLGVRCQEIITTPAADAWRQWLYTWDWEPLPPPRAIATRPRPAGCLVFGDDGLASTATLALLREQQLPVTLVSAAATYAERSDGGFAICPASPQDMVRLYSNAEIAAHDTILFLWSDPEPLEVSAGDFTASVGHCTTILHLLQALPHARLEAGLRLVIATRGCQAVGSEAAVTNPAATALWGLGRVIRHEYPNIACQLIDIGSAPTADDAQLLVSHMLAAAPEAEIAIDRRVAFAHRLRRADPSATPEPIETDTDDPVTLVIGAPGRLDSLHYRMTQRRAPGPGEVEIRVAASALNYKDLLKAMGTIADEVLQDTYFGNAFGMECAGTVIAVGDGVTRLRVGDPVVATTDQGGFRSYVTTSADYVIAKPTTMTLHEAPVFTVFLTAYYALVEVARLQPGERILIHSAAGGVGLAAVQVAQWLGAEIYATAGNDEKRDFLHGLGVRHVMDSRSLTFADEVRALTRGAGVDVVLNALDGEALRQSFALLAPYGRFVEIGKKDIAENNGLPMQTFNRNVSFCAIDLDRIFRDRLALARHLFEAVAQGFEDGRFRALPSTVFAAAEAENAFRFMAYSRHIGKIVLDLTQQPVAALPADDRQAVIRHDATYLITGGTRGFGLEIAKWLVTQGARHLVLLSRSGAAADETKQALTVMASQGVEVLAEAVDVADIGQLRSAMRRITADMPPLRGVIHGAMVLDDGLLAGLDAARLRNVMLPKVLGALHLHALTRDEPLDFFVMLSSVAALAGNVGQGSYAAANAFLDGFAQYRRSLGLTALSIAYGPLAEIGVAARNRQVEEALAAAGLHALPIDHALHSLGRLLSADSTQVGVFLADWQRWRGTHASGAADSLFAALTSQEAGGDGLDLDAHHDLLRLLAALDPEDRLTQLQTVLVEELAGVLQMSVSQIDVQQNVLHLGIDSLLAVELQTRLQGKFGLQLSAMEFTRGLTVAQLAARLLASVAAQIEGFAQHDPDPPTLDARLEAELGEVSEDRWEQLIKEAL